MINDEKNSTAETKTENDFFKIYEPLLDNFINAIKDVKMKNLPEPFIPVSGKGYIKSHYKLAFVGWETRGNYTLAEFYNQAKENKNDALKRFFETIDHEGEGEFPFTTYRNNFGTSFWDFVMKFLEKLYFVDRWETEENYYNILSSFIWGNLDSIERFGITAQKKGANKEDWDIVKKASSIFDHAKHILNAFNPKVIIVLRWQDDKWLTEDLKMEFEQKTLIENQLKYYCIPSNNNHTHVFWTHHPRGLSLDEIDKIIMQILLTIKEKSIFNSFPGERLFQTIDTLNYQLKEFAESLNLSFQRLPISGKDVGFYFENQKWKTCSIGFEFEGKWGNSIFGGICRKDNNIEIINKQVIAQKFAMIELTSDYWPFWFQFEDKYSHWNNSTFEEILNGNLVERIKTEVRNMLIKLEELEKEGFQL